MFSELKSTRYVVLRYRSKLQLPGKGDIDIALKENVFNEAFRLIDRVARSHGIVSRIAVNRYYGKSIFLYKNDGSFFLKLDIHFKEIWKYLECVKMNRLFDGVWCDQNGAKRLSFANEAYLKLIFYFLNGSHLPEKYKHLRGSDIQLLLKDNVPNFALRFYGEKISNNAPGPVNRYSYILLSCIYLLVTGKFSFTVLAGYLKYICRQFRYEQFAIEFYSEASIEDVKEWSNELLPGLPIDFNGMRKSLNPRVNIVLSVGSEESNVSSDKYRELVVVKILKTYEYND